MLYILRKSGTETELARTHSFNQVIDTMNDVIGLHVDCFEESTCSNIYDPFKKEVLIKKEEKDKSLLWPFYIMIISCIAGFIYAGVSL
jgi:hypothetical protein